MYVTTNYIFHLRRKTKFIHVKPTHYFLVWYVHNYRVLNALSNQKLPRIKRRSLVTLL